MVPTSEAKADISNAFKNVGADSYDKLALAQPYLKWNVIRLKVVRIEE